MSANERLSVGLRRTESLQVVDELTVGYSVTGMPMVFATPQMIHHMEVVAAASIASYLPCGWVSVGTHVDVAHLAATPVGAKVTTRAELVEIDNLRVVFAVEAYDERAQIGRGRHERALVEMARFVRGLTRT